MAGKIKLEWKDSKQYKENNNFEDRISQIIQNIKSGIDPLFIEIMNTEKEISYRRKRFQDFSLTTVDMKLNEAHRNCNDAIRVLNHAIKHMYDVKVNEYVKDQK